MAAFLLVLAVAPGPAPAVFETLTPAVDLRCRDEPTGALHCQYRLPAGGALSGITARSGGEKLELRTAQDYPWPGALTAVLMVIDTSDPGREPVVRGNEEHVSALAGVAAGHHVMGLAAFDSRLRVVAPIGSPPDALRRSAASLHARGMTTELYRSLLEAVRVLETVKADRRVVLVFSDGQAEDKAYFHHDVVAAARSANVVISSVGFARSVAQSVSLQTLRRLSEETGGLYIDAGTGTRLPADFANRVFANIDSGGRFTLGPPRPPEAINLQFSPLRGPAFHVTLPRAADTPAATAANAAAAPPVATPEIRVLASEPARDEIDTVLWYSVPVALLVLITLTLLTLILIARRPAAQRVETLSVVRPLAYLVAQDEKGTRYPVTATIWRIGRSRDNELMLDDNSISRRHAELQRGADGRFTLLDRNSLNGVFVNGEKVGRRELNEGDVIELGDIALRFTEAPADDQLSERTSMQNTRAPHVN